jgi:hypothetical protein
MNGLRGRMAATLLIAVFMISTMTLMVSAHGPKKDYNTITEGEVFYSSGHYLEGTSIPTGFDVFGYNYQGHMFKGSYYNSYAGAAGYGPWTGDDVAYLGEFPVAESHWAWPYREIKLTMKWSDTWLSNMDRNDDSKLDRGWPINGPSYTSSAAPGAWLTNHQFGENDDGTNWNYFVKIVYAPSEWIKIGDLWYDADNVEMGSIIWGSYARILQVSNDPYLGEHGVIYNPSSPTGFGYYNP